MTQGLAHYAIKDHVAVVQIDHPPINALDIPTKEALARVFQELESDVWASLSATRDMKEGAKAFIEKRKPTWEMK